MDSSEQNKITAFDTLFSTNHIQMLKIILSYTDNQMQKSLAVYIKFLELNYTIDFYKRTPYPLCGCIKQETSFDIFKMCDELFPYCTETEKKQIEQIRNIFQSMEMYKEMSKTMEIMKDFMPDMGNMFQSDYDTNQKNDSPHESDQGSGNFDMMNMLMNMLSPKQKEMFEMLGGDTHAD